MSPHLDAPATPERVLNAIDALRAKIGNTLEPGLRERRNERLAAGAEQPRRDRHRRGLVTVVEVKGSTPREAGTKMVVTRDKIYDTSAADISN